MTTLRRHPILLLTIFCVLSAAFLNAAPFLHRRYALAGTVQATIPPYPAIPEFARLPQATLSDFKPSLPANIQITLADSAAGNSPIQFSAVAADRNAAWIQVQKTADQFSAALHQHAEDLLAAHNATLQKSATRLAAAEDALSREIEAFRLAHRGALPDDPNSIVSQFEKLSAKLEDRQQRLQFVTQQITRLQERRKNPAGAAPLPASPDSTAAPADQDDDDPEVITLKAQLQLLNDQLEEQLGTLRRTEQHPYVIDLRKKQASLQKKLDAAKERATAGQPPPPDARPPVAATGATGNGKSQLQALQNERDMVDTEVHVLTAQRDALQKQVDDVLPIRQQFTRLDEQLSAAHKDRQAVQTQLQEFSRQFKSTDSPRASIVEISPVVMTSNSTLPSFPQLPLVYAVTLAIAFAAAALLAFLLHRADKSLHSLHDAAAALVDVPVLGAISEIRSAAQQTRRKLWHYIFRPIVVAALLAVTLASALVCYRHLADPAFPHMAAKRGPLSPLFAAAPSETPP